MNPSGSRETLVEALETLEEVVPAATKQYLRGLDETGLRREHWGLGIAIRSVLGLGRDDSPLAQWFRARGVTTPEAMGDQILRAYWRRLRGLEPEGQPAALAAAAPDTALGDA